MSQMGTLPCGGLDVVQQRIKTGPLKVTLIEGICLVQGPRRYQWVDRRCPCFPLRQNKTRLGLFLGHMTKLVPRCVLASHSLAWWEKIR